MFKTSFFALWVCLFGIGDRGRASSMPEYMDSVHKAIVERWLEKNPKYHLALDSDCGCDGDISLLRDGYGGDKNYTIPNYHPYYVMGDFNEDGKMDFAVAVKNKIKKDNNLQMLVFNGPFQDLKSVKPPFIFGHALQLGQGLFYFPKQKHARLLFGTFESEGCWLEPEGTGYKVDWDREL